MICRKFALVVLVLGLGALQGAPWVAAQELSRGEQILVGISQTVQRVVKEATPKTVAIKIHVSQMGQQGEGWGTGAIISSDGYILTCAHVIEPGKSWTIILADGTEYEAKKIGINSTNDYCLIKIDAKNLPHFTYADSDLVGLRQWVVALGHPGGPYADQLPAVAVGRVTGLSKQIPIGGQIPLPGMPGMKLYDQAIQHDAPIFSGNSGGPLVDLEGELIGINGAILLINENAYATPINEILGDMADLKTGKEIKGRMVPNAMQLQQELLKEVDPKDIEKMMGNNPLARMFGGGGMQGQGADAETLERNRKRSRTYILQQTFTSIGKKANAATVEILDGKDCVGYGVIVSADGNILTNDRFFGKYDAEKAKLTVRTRDGKSYEGKLIGRDGQLEVALLDIEADGLPAARFGDSAKLIPGQWVLTGGGETDNPLLGGVVSAVNREVEEGRMIPTMGLMGLFGGPPPNKSPVRPYKSIFQHDTPMETDTFGSPLFNTQGELIGLNCGQFYRGSSYAIPTNPVKKQLEALKTGVRVDPPKYQDQASADPLSQLFGNLFGGGEGDQGGNPLQRMLENLFGGGQGGPNVQGPPPGSAYLGVQIDPNSQDGVGIIGVVPGEAADQAGLQQGDLIIDMDNAEIATFQDLRDILAKKKPGDKVEVIVRRDDQGKGVEKTLTITLGERK